MLDGMIMAKIGEMVRDVHPELGAVAEIYPLGLRLCFTKGDAVAQFMIDWYLLDRVPNPLIEVERAITNGVEAVTRHA